VPRICKTSLSSSIMLLYWKLKWLLLQKEWSNRCYNSALKTVSFYIFPHWKLQRESSINGILLRLLNLLKEKIVRFCSRNLKIIKESRYHGLYSSHLYSTLKLQFHLTLFLNVSRGKFIKQASSSEWHL